MILPNHERQVTALVEITLTGSRSQIGFSRGAQLKYAIQLAVEHYVYYHTHQYSVDDAREYGLRMAEDMQQRCPAVLEEITHTAKGADIPEDIMFAYAFRCWNALMEHPATLACFNLSCIDPGRGPIMAGVLEDGPPFYMLEKVIPEKGHPFHAVTWAGMDWAVRCMNAEGLAIGQASAFAGTRFSEGSGGFPFDLYARGFYAERWAIQNAATVDEAIDIMRDFDCASTFMLADRSGKVAVLEACGRLHAIREPDETGVLTGGVFLSPNWSSPLIDEGIAHDWEEGVRKSKRVSADLHNAQGHSTMDWMAEYLQTEVEDGGWCHDGLQAATIACPANGEFWVSGYRPCAHGFTRHQLP